MVLVSVMYPNEAGSSFNHEYYLQKHIPLVRERWSPMGLVDERVVRGVARAIPIKRPRFGRPRPFRF